MLWQLSFFQGNKLESNSMIFASQLKAFFGNSIQGVNTENKLNSFKFVYSRMQDLRYLLKQSGEGLQTPWVMPRFCKGPRNLGGSVPTLPTKCALEYSLWAICFL